MPTPTPTRIQCRTYDVGPEELPYPATKLIITQHFCYLDEAQLVWAWIIVGAFYDQQDNIIWSTEKFFASSLLQDSSPELTGDDWYYTTPCKNHY